LWRAKLAEFIFWKRII